MTEISKIIYLQEHSSDCLSCHLKGKIEQVMEPAKIQSVLCEDALLEKNNRGLKISMSKICLRFVYAKECKEKQEAKQLMLFTLSCEWRHTELCKQQRV